jgi:hypothetical protein
VPTLALFLAAASPLLSEWELFEEEDERVCMVCGYKG